MKNTTQVITIPVQTSTTRLQLKQDVMDALEFAQTSSKNSFFVKTQIFERKIDEMLNFVKSVKNQQIVLLPILSEARLREDFEKIEKLAKKG